MDCYVGQTNVTCELENKRKIEVSKIRYLGLNFKPLALKHPSVAAESAAAKFSHDPVIISIVRT